MPGTIDWRREQLTETALWCDFAFESHGRARKPLDLNGVTIRDHDERALCAQRR